MGFQNQEDEALLEEGGSASVRYWYTRTVLPKFASYSMSITLRQRTHRYQSPFFESPLPIRLKTFGCQHQEDALQWETRSTVYVLGTRAHTVFRWRAYSPSNHLR